MVDGLSASNASTDTNGILQTSLLLPEGFHTVEILQMPNHVSGEDLISEAMTIYPNPVSTEATLMTTRDLHNATLEVINALGNTRMTMNHLYGSEQAVNFGHLESGVYFIRITQDKVVMAIAKMIISD